MYVCMYGAKVISKRSLGLFKSFVLFVSLYIFTKPIDSWVVTLFNS